MLEKGFDQYIRTISIDLQNSEKSQYPFTLKAVQELKTLELHPNVTFLVGENGSGKSTLLEAVAIAYGFNPEGGSKNFNFATKETHSILSEYIKIARGVKRAKDGFFLRAESFYNLASQIDELDLEMFGASISASYGGKSLHHQSHGESFMSLVMNRFGGRGIYILDEPEAALSPTRQMALMSRIHQLVLDNSQFIIATHSPMIMAYPNAVIYNVEKGFEEIKYEETEHYQVTKGFLNNPKKMLDILLS